MRVFLERLEVCSARQRPWTRGDQAPRPSCWMPAEPFADSYRRCVEECQRAGVEPVPADRAAELLAESGALFLFSAVYDRACGNSAGSPA